jgi:hypothetical protein
MSTSAFYNIDFFQNAWMLMWTIIPRLARCCYTPAET